MRVSVFLSHFLLTSESLVVRFFLPSSLYFLLLFLLLRLLRRRYVLDLYHLAEIMRPLPDMLAEAYAAWLTSVSHCCSPLAPTSPLDDRRRRSE